MEYMSYYDLLEDVVYNGCNYAHTHLLNNVTYRVDCEGVANAVSEVKSAPLDAPKPRSVIVPEMRGHLPFSNTYALTELVWYCFGSRNASEIQDFAPLWGRIAQGGKVNSNYGYQLRVNNLVVGGFDAAAASIARGLYRGARQKVSLDIVSQSNMQDDFDTVCNNRVDVIIEPDGRMHLRVVARSIDMIFGLPYDQFNAQILGHYIAQKLNDSFVTEGSLADECGGVYLSSVTFDIANVHVYNDDLNNMVIRNFSSHNLYGNHRVFDYDDLREFVNSTVKATTSGNAFGVARYERTNGHALVKVANSRAKNGGIAYESVSTDSAVNRACDGEMLIKRGAHSDFEQMTRLHLYPRYSDIDFANLVDKESQRFLDSYVKFGIMLKNRKPSDTGYGDRKRVFLTGAGEIMHIYYAHETSAWFVKTYEPFVSLKDLCARNADT